MRTKPIFLHFGLIWLCCLLSWSPVGQANQLTFLPQWSPQAQFAGYYVAAEKGFYRQHGVELTLLRGGPQLPAGKALASKEAEIVTLFLSTALQHRDKGVPLVNLAQIVQKSALLLVAKKSSGIKTPEDLDGKKVSLWDEFSIQPKALFKRYRLDVQIIPQSYTLNLFLRNGVDAASAMWYNEYHTLLTSGYEESDLTVFFLDQFGINFPEDGIYTLEETYNAKPALCHAFVKASIEGWTYAFQHEEEALDFVMKYVEEANLPTNRVHQQWMLRRMKDIILPLHHDGALGDLKEDDYTYVTDILRSYQVIGSTPDYSTFIRREP
ncbi:MAG: ABC transporter substrate-binding protein [bacterium]|jgi:NitT/TauT family transport system substrate-binding protein|nr:ABC transporter substrate-binding protein [bacterium]